jgi:hypothetical protein
MFTLKIRSTTIKTAPRSDDAECEMERMDTTTWIVGVDRVTRLGAGMYPDDFMGLGLPYDNFELSGLVEITLPPKGAGSSTVSGALLEVKIGDDTSWILVHRASLLGPDGQTVEILA